MSEMHPNWAKLVEAGAEGRSSASGSSLSINNLPMELAINLGYAYVQSLDQLGDYPQYAGYSREEASIEATQRQKLGHQVVFGEFRPADRNCAVRIEQSENNTFSLYADVRNNYEDQPELDGNKKLQQKFIEAVESIEISNYKLRDI